VRNASAIDPASRTLLVEVDIDNKGHQSAEDFWRRSDPLEEESPHARANPFSVLQRSLAHRGAEIPSTLIAPDHPSARAKRGPI
jgi:hypothetical protein